MSLTEIQFCYNKYMANEDEQLPPQQSAEDTSNWDDRVSTTPDGDMYIKSPDEDNLLSK